MGRISALVSVSVSSEACACVTAVAGGGPELTERVKSRTPDACAGTIATTTPKKTRAEARARMSMAIIVLAVHDVRAPRIKPDIGHAFDLLRLAVDDIDGVIGSAGEIELLVGKICRRGLDEEVLAGQADFDAAGRLQSRQVVDIFEGRRGGDDEPLAGRKVHARHVLAGSQCRGDFISRGVDDGDGFVAIVDGDPVLAVMAHIEAPGILADADRL